MSERTEKQIMTLVKSKMNLKMKRIEKQKQRAIDFV